MLGGNLVTRSLVGNRVVGGTWTLASGATLTLPALTLAGTITGGAQVLSNLGTVYIGDTACANVTLGLVVNQGAADNGLIAGKSSDVAHPFTDLAETDTYVMTKKAEAAAGGLFLGGYKSNAGIAGAAMILGGYLGEAADTTKTSAGRAIVEIQGLITDAGTGAAEAGADSNIVAIRGTGATGTYFLFDREGSAHADVEWTAFDKYDDMAMVQDLELCLRGRETEAQTYRRHALEESGIIGKDSWHEEDGKLKAMVNTTKLAMLHHGALIQAYERIGNLEQKLLMEVN